MAIPTTAGTGSETDGGAVITNPETQEKTGIFGPGTMPVLAVIDPELMTSVPATFKAYQGFDALFHSTEGFISNQRNEMSKMVAAEAIRNVSRNLSEAIRHPENVEPMSKVAFGSVKLQEDCGLADLKMSDYGITPDEFPKMAQNAKDTLGINFLNDPCELSNEDCIAIYEESYK